MKGKLHIATALLFICTVVFSNHLCAQLTTVSKAREYAAAQNYDKAIDLYGELYGISPDSVYAEYLQTLIAAKKYKKAETVVAQQMTVNQQNPFLHIDLGKVYALDGKEARAKEEYDKMLNMLNGDDIFTAHVVKAFIDAGREDYAILSYERVLQITGNAYLIIYGTPLAKLYAKSGHLDKAIDVLLGGAPGQNLGIENAKSVLLEVLGSDEQKLAQTQKIMLKKINEQPENIYYTEILTWIYTQRNDWDGALIQIEAVDERNKEDGRRLMTFAGTASFAKQYETAIKAFDDVIAKGPASPNYTAAKGEKLKVGLTQLKNNPAYTPEDVSRLMHLYDTFLIEFPKYYSTTTAADYAMLEAQYAGNAAKGIEILKRAVAEPETRREVAGRFKLQMGDYYLLTGKLWDASLTYSQVDKEFKQDPMGEDARFRNAKLAYYRGDFDWAQKQLSILKSATSELIANDALYLSVLITENVEDSVILALRRYAHADLLLFQNKDKEAEALLDSINKAFPKHPLNDDILMLRAEIAKKHREYDKALAYLENIYKNYGQDVLGDDAVFKMADIYHDFLHQNDKAKHYYEQLIIEYPGSTYVQSARQKLAEINAPATP